MDEFLAELHVAVLRARSEPTNIYLFAQRAAEEPATFLLFEGWQDEAVFRAEVLTRDYFQAYLAATQPMYVAPVKVTVWSQIIPAA